MIRPRCLVGLAWLVVVTGLTISGCSEAAGPPTPAALSGMDLDADFTGAGQVPGALSAASTLPTIDRSLKALSSVAARIEYTSTSAVTGQLTRVSGTVFAPKGDPPEGGWPIIAYGHATTGIQTDCAPSLSPTLLGSSSVIVLLIRAGYAVTMPDYQGLGVEGQSHPYLDSKTAGYNMIDAVRAARRLVRDVSDRWLAVGLSQGGQAAWAANELATEYGAGLVLLGSASMSPPADITGFADGAATGQLTREGQRALVAILASLKGQHPDFNLDDYRRGIVEQKWSVLTACEGPALDELGSVTARMTADDLRPSGPAAVETLRNYLLGMSLPQRPTTAPMLVIYGGNDPLIPEAWTDRAIAAACGMGDVIDIQFQPEKGHTDIDVSTAFDWIIDRFNGVPAPNGCASLAPPPEPPEAVTGG